MKRLISLILVALMILTVLPMSALATEVDESAAQDLNVSSFSTRDGYDTSVSNDYFTVISENEYNLAPGAKEIELVLNNSSGNDRKVVHYFEVDTKNEDIDVLPGYYGIDKLDPDNLALNGVEDKTQFWKAEQLTKTVAYYKDLGYNVVGAMNTALAYDSDAPYGYMVWDGVVLGSPEVHKGAQTYLAIDAEGNCELRSMSTPLDGSEVTAISANFGWLVKNGVLSKTTVERTSSDASRSMIGIKADGTLVFCQVDGRNDPFSGGLSDYEMGEMMLALGCVNAVNCDGGGSSTFVSKREGETEAIMRSVPSDGSERATINSVIIVSNAKPTGEFDHAVLSTDYDYYAPGTSAKINVNGVDASGAPANDIPYDDLSWNLSDSSFGYIDNGVFVSNGTLGDVTVQLIYNDVVVGEKLLHIVNPDVFALLLDETVLPYGKSMVIDFACTYGADDWAVCVDGVYTLALSDENAAALTGNALQATSDESYKGVNVTATYTPDPTVTDVLIVTYGKGSEIIYDFEDGTTSGFVNFDAAKQHSIDNGINNTLVGKDPLAGQFSEQVASEVFVSDKIVRNGKYALAWSIDNTDAGFSGWTYNVIFNIGETIVLRDVANGKSATTLGMWLYIPEGSAGLAFQSQLYTKSGDTLTHFQEHFTFTTVSGAVKNLNSCTEADIPESRWVYATINLTAYDYVCTPVASLEGNNRTPSFIRAYIKPMVPAIHTFYIDDITLDYSSAVDDRVLPTISNVSYTTQDESVTLTEGATINGNSVSFSAVIADNVKLDYATGKIYVDGNELENVSASGKYLATTSNVALTSGVHTVAFEIKDALGNPMKVTRTFTITGDAAVVLSGHNDSGKKPEYGSVYYVDVNVADISAVNELTTALLLQDANTWEPQGIEVAEGFAVSYTLDEVENILYLTIERNDEVVDETVKTIVSVPVRLWTWDAINHITGDAIAPETQYATGNCPVVTVDCEVVQGLINSIAPFGGAISVETMINDIVNPWHYHDKDLTVLAKDATCTVNGYANRTYCVTCASVIGWGTVIKATGHNYAGGSCTGCGMSNTVTGLVEENGNWYYYINGVAASGWQMIDSDWYYFDNESKIGAEGELELFGGVVYTFEHGKLTTGVWAPTLFGMRYYYGPNYYGQGNRLGLWVNIDGKDYFFESNGLRLEDGWQLILENQIYRNWYYFDENGVCADKNLKPADGFYTDRNGLAYSKNGQASYGEHLIDGKYYYFDPIFGYAEKGEIAGRLYGDDYTAYTGLLEKNGVMYYYLDGRTGPCGLVKVDGDYYYSSWGGVIKTGKYYISDSYCDLPVGEYVFGEDGKAVNGVYDSILYANGKKASEGLYFINGDYYLADSNASFRKNGTYYVSKTYCDLPANRNYAFGADGKMLNGVVDIDGTLYLYINGVTATYGLYEIDGDYYYSSWGGKLMTDDVYYVGSSYCDLPGNANYAFGVDGKMLNGVVDVDGVPYLYSNGTTTTYGLYEIDGDYYYSYWGGKLMTDDVYYIASSYCDLPANRNYAFGADGKMLNGVVDIDGTLYLYINGVTATYGLYEIDGDYYYSYWGGKLMTDDVYYIGSSYCDLPGNANYSFGADGKMLNGVVDVDGVPYLYSNGTTTTYGLYEIDGDYYYSYWGGKLMTDDVYFISSTYCDLPANRNYAFGADGKMLNGFVTIDDNIYYYVNGATPLPGIIKVDDDYYFVNWGGIIVRNKRFYVFEGAGYTIEMTYTFNEAGKIIG